MAFFDLKWSFLILGKAEMEEKEVYLLRTGLA